MREMMSEASVYFGYRAMYEGKSGARHTLVLYARANESQYYGAFRGASLAEIEIKFRNSEELQRKLLAAKDKLEEVL